MTASATLRRTASSALVLYVKMLPTSAGAPGLPIARRSTLDTQRAFQMGLLYQNGLIKMF